MHNKIIKFSLFYYSFWPPLLFPLFACFCCCCCCFFVCVFLFNFLISLSLTLIIGIFYCLNDTLLLLHLITTKLVSHLSLSSIVFIVFTLIIGIFYCLNYTSLLLHASITYLVNLILDALVGKAHPNI